MSAAAHVDTETFSEISVRDVGPCRYAEHPSTEILCLAWAIGDEEPKLWEPSQSISILDPLFCHIEDGGIVKAWNCAFELAVWPVLIEQLGGRDYVPEVEFGQWRDPSAVAASLAFPLALEKCGAALELEVVKDKRGKWLLNKLAKPRRPSKNNPATRWTPAAVPQDYQDLYEYCLQDVRSERAIDQALPLDDLSPSELETWRMTLRLNQRGWTIDLEAARRMVILLEDHKIAAQGELAEITDGAVTTGGQLDRMLVWLATQGVTLPNLQADTIKDALRAGPPAPARRLLELRQELSKSSTKKYKSMRTRACRDGTVKDNLVHHGATTGRDAGRGLQIQNFPSASVSSTPEGVAQAVQILTSTALGDLRETVELFYGSPTQFASKMSRSMLTAAPDHDLYCADFSSIENRITVWLAQDKGGIDLFAEGLDQYRQFIAADRGVPYDQVTDAQRKTAKPIILGCCFGMGKKTFKATQERFGVDCTLEEADLAVQAYRRQYLDVVRLWAGLNQAVMDAIEWRRPTRYKLIAFEVRGDYLYLGLPSGREIAYFKPVVQDTRMPWGEVKPAPTAMRQVGPGRTWMRTAISPGTFTENAVQATARDLLMHAAKLAERLGYLSVGRIHDELVNQMRRGLDGSLEEFMACMSTAAMPRWLTHPEKGYSTIPIEAEGWVGQRFRK